MGLAHGGLRTPVRLTRALLGIALVASFVVAPVVLLVSTPAKAAYKGWIVPSPPIPGAEGPIGADGAGNLYVLTDGSEPSNVAEVTPSTGAVTYLPIRGLDSYTLGSGIMWAIVHALSDPIFGKDQTVGEFVHTGNIAVDPQGDVFIRGSTCDWWCENITGSEDLHIEELPAGSTQPITLPFDLGDPLETYDYMATDPFGDLFVSDGKRNQVLELYPGASAPVVVPVPSWVQQVGPIGADANGDLFVGELGNYWASGGGLYTSTTPIVELPSERSIAGASWGAPIGHVLPALDAGVSRMTVDAEGDITACGSDRWLLPYDAAAFKIDSFVSSYYAADPAGDTFSYEPGQDPAHSYLEEPGEMTARIPALTTQPVSQTAAAGQLFSFTSAATGNPTPTVQWQQSTDGGTTWTDINGATSPTYSDWATLQMNGEKVRAVWSNFFDTVDSQAATLTTLGPPTVTLNPSDTDTVAGHSFGFWAAASGTPTPTVQWQQSTDGGTTWTNVSGATSPTLVANAPNSPCTTERFRAVFTNLGGSVDTDPATLTIDCEPVITQQPADVTVAAGATFSFTALASGPPAPTVQWISNVGGFLNGATSTTYSATASPALDGATFTAEFTNDVGTVFSRAATLHVSYAPAITSAASTSLAITGTSPLFSVTTTGDPRPSITETGALPTGVTFVDNGDGTAKFVGTPGAGTAGDYPLTIAASNGVSPDAQQSFVLHVTQLPIFTGPQSAFLTFGVPGTFTISTTGGTQVPTLTESGALPTGMSFTDNGNGTATVSGTPTQTGTFAFTVSAHTTLGSTGTGYTVVVVNTPATFTSPASASFTSGVFGSFSVTTTSIPAAHLSLVLGSLPAGLSFVDNGDGTGTISGTPAAGTSGQFTVRLQADDGAPSVRTQNLTITVGIPPTLIPASFTFNPGTNQTFTVVSSGSPSAGLAESGALPPGISFTDQGNGTAHLSGSAAIAAEGNSYLIIVTASNGFGANAVQSYTVYVNTPPTIEAASTAYFTPGKQGSFTIGATGTPACTFTESGALPSGVHLIGSPNSYTAQLFGTPAAGTQGSYPVTVTASNGVSPAATANVTVVVGSAPTITSPATTTVTAASPASFAVTTSGSPAPSLGEAGTLPPGMTFTDNGDGTATIAGTPQTASATSYAIQLSAANGLGQVTKTLTITVQHAPTITSSPLFSLTYGQFQSFTITTTGNPTATLSETGTLPTNMVFFDNGDGTATLNGGPGGSPGLFQVSFTATNAAGTFSQSVDIVVSQAPHFITSGPAPITSGADADFVAGSASTFTAYLGGYPTPSYTVTGALPSGITLTNNGDDTFSLGGTADVGTEGTYPVTITADNNAGSASISFNAVVEAPFEVTSVIPNSGFAGTKVALRANYPLTGVSQVMFGSTPATTFSVNSTHTVVTATAPAGTGTVDVSITAEPLYPGQAITTLDSTLDQFTYRIPAITRVSPNKGPTAGGTTVTITGTSFGGATRVLFGATPAASFKMNTTTSITAVSPPGAVGAVDVRVETPYGTSPVVTADRYTYQATTVTKLSPAYGPAAGGTTVTITGTSFAGATQVLFGTTAATSFTPKSATSVVAVAPPGTPGTVDVRVVAPSGMSAAVAADHFAYKATTVTRLAPNTGPTAGGTTVVITGTYFTGATSVVFGANSAAFTVSSATSITALSPPGAVGKVSVRVVDPSGTTAPSTASYFSYQ
jgi:hypothetical protein